MGVYMPPPDRLKRIQAAMELGDWTVVDAEDQPVPANPADPAEAFRTASAELKDAEAESINAALRLKRDLFFTYGGVAYRAPAVSFTNGLRLALLKRQLAVGIRAAQRYAEERERGERPATDAQDVVEMAELCADAVKLFRELVVPVSFSRRLAWKMGWMPNPFRNASEAEVGALLDFFTKCRSIDRVHLLSV